MTTDRETGSRPDLAQSRTPSGTSGANREERLKTLYARWDQFAGEYERARTRGDQEVMTNLRGLMLLIKREIKRLGGELRDFPYPDEPHLADL